MEKKPINVRLQGKLIELVESKAESEHRSQSSVVLEALDNYFEESQDDRA